MQAMSQRAAATSTEAPRRRYNSTRRALQAAQTREDVLAAAIRLFTSSGWAATTVAAVATEAGVSAETVYGGFGSKKNLLRAAIDVAVVGDADPVPFIDREEFQRLGRGTVAARLRAGVALQANVHERSAGVWRAIIEAAVGDPEVESWRIELERGRRLDLRRSLALILGRDLDTPTIDLLWVLLGPETYLKLMGDAGYDRARYEQFLLDAIERILPRTARRRPPS
jgi:AcrR family transcriptional regulator